MRGRKRRRKRSFSKMGIIYLGIFISLNLIGLGYGHWSSIINMENTMVTGDVKAAFSRNLSSVGFENVIYQVSDERNMNIIMNVDMVNPCEAYFEIVNNGTLPIAINNQTFQPIRDVIIAGVPVNIKIDFDVPGAKYFNPGLENGYIEPGNKGYGKVIVEVPEQFRNISLGLMNDELVNNNIVGMGFEGLAVGNIITESQSIPIDIPIGCGTWEDVLTLNTTLNVSRILTIQLPETNNGEQRFTYFEDQNENNTFMFSQASGYTYLPDGNNTYSYIVDENESRSIFGNGEINYNNPSIRENGTNTNAVYQFNNGGN